MLTVLIRKEFHELFRGYFVNRKSGAVRSKFSVIALFILFAGIMLLLGGMFYGMALMLGKVMFSLSLEWLYFALMGILSVLLGAFGSVFNTYALLYQAKDNDTLLSLPLSSMTILLSRMFVVYGMSFLYGNVVWIPAVLYAGTHASLGFLSVIHCILLCLILPLFITALTCALGWIVALIASKIKSKSILTAAISVFLIAAYYFVYFRLVNYLSELTSHAAELSSGVRTFGNLFYQLGSAANGSIGAFMIFSGISIALFALCLWILTKSFFYIVTRSPSQNKKAETTVIVKSRSISEALFQKEMKRFTSSALYMLNCALADLILPIITILLFIKRSSLLPTIEKLSAMFPEIIGFLPLVIALALSFCISTNDISTPSVSLEGKNLWILRTLPVSGAEILRQKRKVHIWITAVPTLLCSLLICFCMKLDTSGTILTTLFCFLMIELTATFGLWLGVKRPNFTWTNETVPIKQSMNILYAWLFGWIIVLAVGGIGYLTRNICRPEIYFTVVIILLAVITRYFTSFVLQNGGAAFDTLS